MRQVVTYIMILLFIFSTACRKVNIDTQCPAGIGAKFGDKPKIVSRPQDGETLLVCGYQMGSTGKDARFMSEFEVIEGGRQKRILFQAGAVETYLVQLSNDPKKLTLTRYIWMPVEKVRYIDLDDGRFQIVPFTSFDIYRDKAGYSAGKPACAYDLKLNREEIDKIMADVRSCGQSESPVCAERVGHQLLACALSGNAEAVLLLNDPHKVLKIIDGVIAENISTAKRLLKEYNDVCGVFAAASDVEPSFEKYEASPVLQKVLKKRT